MKFGRSARVGEPLAGQGVRVGPIGMQLGPVHPRRPDASPGRNPLRHVLPRLLADLQKKLGFFARPPAKIRLSRCLFSSAFLFSRG